MSTTQKISTPVIKSIKINISKRFMHRIINSFGVQKFSSAGNKLFTRNACYSSNTIKQPSEHTKKVNPTVPGTNDQYHKAIVTTECPKTDCRNNICPKPCEYPVNSQITAHFRSTTFLTPEEILDKKIKKVADNNYKGENKPQYASTYNKPYTAKPGELKVHKDSTDFLKNNLKNPKDVDDPEN